MMFIFMGAHYRKTRASSCAMRLNLAYHPAVSPMHLLDTCIEAYLAHSAKRQLVFGDPDQKTLNSLNPSTNRAFLSDIKIFIQDTSLLLDALNAPPKVSDTWNEASENLYYAYKHVVTQQNCFNIKSDFKSHFRM